MSQYARTTPTFEREVTHDMAWAALERFTATHFRKQGVPHSRASIPVQPDDDDIVLGDYIIQQQAKDQGP